MISSFLKFEITNNDAKELMLKAQRTNTMNEQSNLGIHHDSKMANLHTSYTLQQQPIIDYLMEQYLDGFARVDDDLSTHYTQTIQHEIPGKGEDKPL